MNHPRRPVRVYVVARFSFSCSTPTLSLAFASPTIPVARYPAHPLSAAGRWGFGYGKPGGLWQVSVVDVTAPFLLSDQTEAVAYGPLFSRFSAASSR